MYEKLVRQMNEGERAELRGLLFRAHKAQRRGMGCLLGAPISIAGAICLWMLAKEILIQRPPLLAEDSPSSELPWYWLPICVAIGVCGPVLSIWEVITLGRRHRLVAQQLQDELDSNFVEVERIQATAVAEVLDASEHEGREPVLAYVFDIGSGQVFMVPATKLTQVVGQPWPSVAFEVLRSARHKIPIGIFPCGEPLRPIRCVEVDGDALLISEDNTIWSGSLNTLEPALLEQFGR